MSKFGKKGVRCDGCGIVSASVDGYYVDGYGKGGTIGSGGRRCAHDLCESCDGALAPNYACPKCGELPDGFVRTPDTQGSPRVLVGREGGYDQGTPRRPADR